MGETDVLEVDGGSQRETLVLEDRERSRTPRRKVQYSSSVVRSFGWDGAAFGRIEVADLGTESQRGGGQGQERDEQDVGATPVATPVVDVQAEESLSLQAAEVIRPRYRKRRKTSVE